MKKQNNPTQEPIKPNLKHDNMEYAAPTGGDDILDADTETTLDFEEKEITAEELELLQQDDVDVQATALYSAETDSQADEDNFLTEKENMEEFVDDNPDEEEQERKD